MLDGRREHLVEIDRIRLAAIDDPAGRMGDDRDVWILERAENPLGDLLARLLLAVVNAGDHPIALGQHIVRQIHAALFEDVALDAFEHDEVVELVVELVDFLPLFAEPGRVEAVGHAHALRVVGDRDVFEPALLGGGDHFAQARLAVAGGGVHVEVADEVGQLDQLWAVCRRPPSRIPAGLRESRAESSGRSSVA